MPAAVQILCGPTGAGKTTRLLERHAEIARAAPGTVLWLGPTRRAVDAVRQRLRTEMRSIVGVNLFTFQDFAEAVIFANDPAARPLSDLQRRLLADDLVAELHAAKELSHFDRVIDTRGFAEGVFTLLAELKRNEIWPEDLTRALRGRTAGAKERQCVQLYTRYQERLIRHNLYDLEGRIWYARDLLGHGKRAPFVDVRAVFVDGFTHFTRTQHEILEALAGTAKEVWITLPDELGDDRAELFARPRQTLVKLAALRPVVERVTSTPRKEGARSPAPPAGLAHLERQLFRPLRSITPTDDASGIRLIEAPGMLGEARLVAREIKQSLLDGTVADDIVVSLRDVAPYADVLREVFAEYGIPLDVEGTEPLLRNPAIATLLRALRLPEEDWPFAAVTALLRSSYFQPDWPETRCDPTVAQHAEALLRLLGEPRGRDAYLKAVDRWAEHPPTPLEDEEGEEPRRRRTHDLAGRCRSFLRRFFASWDSAPPRAPLAEHIAWLRSFLDDLGIGRAGERRDRVALTRLLTELDDWARLEGQLGASRERDRIHFTRLLATVATGTGIARTPRGPGRVRVLSAELACELNPAHLFVMGLGERSFPDLSAPEPFFDETQRQEFRTAGLDFPGIADRMPDEMLLFYRLLTGARQRLVLSYPAVDPKGQALLPSSFLNAVLDCFGPGRVPTTRQQMLIQGYATKLPLSPAEYRVQAATSLAALDPKKCALGSDLSANLVAAASVVQRRLQDRDFGAYDGLLRHPAALAEVQTRCGADRVFSPTALEAYIACPYRFFLEQVLHLEPLEEPREEIEQTGRGAAFHRALSRLHRTLQAAGVHHPDADVNEQLLAQLSLAIEEYATDAPSPASQELWRIEGKRLRRAAGRYRDQWQKFIGPWAERRIAPRPRHFEAGFGLKSGADAAMAAPLLIRVDGVEVRVGGRVDRVDVADLPDGPGFWIIDYKTGNASHYTGKDLQEFRRLQLTLYAVAVEEVLFAESGARPLGLAYWLVTDSGPKTVWPGTRQLTSWLDDGERWRRVSDLLKTWVVSLVAHIRQGDFPLKPRSEDCTETCDFAQVCRIGHSRREVEAKTWQLELPVLPPEKPGQRNGTS